MSMFRRPTDDSSDSETSSEEEESGTEELDHSNAGTDHSNAGTEEIIGTDLTTTATLSSGESISFDHSRDDATVGDVEHVRNMMLASLLEDFYRTRAAEVLNAANPGASFHRQSPEVQPLARTLFAQAGKALSSNGLLPTAMASSELRSMRSQYLAGFDTFGLQNLKSSEVLLQPLAQSSSPSNGQLALIKASGVSQVPTADTSIYPMSDMALRTARLSIVPHPANDMQMSTAQPTRSHYKSSFQEVQLLGRGGFGRVYQTFNVFDKKEYAVKKIPLSVKLSQQYREKGHAELASVLREVQALAQLDHCNVVRYHATWIEDPITPTQPNDPPIFRTPFNRQRLIADRPTFSPVFEDRRRSSARLRSIAGSDNIMFEADSADEGEGHNHGLEWSHHSNFRRRESSTPDSDIFTDGMAQNVRSDKAVDDPTCYVLHVQMSMYPQTLAQYLSTAHSSTQNGSVGQSRRHCFHLIPALRILLGILYGLQYIHARGLVHRDIKPSNIFLSNAEAENYIRLPDGYHDVGTCPSCPGQQPYHVNPRIGDFGLVADLAGDVRNTNGSQGSSSSAVGTEYYRPPTGSGKKVASVIDEKLDVYALGVVFTEMLWRCGTNMERIHLLKNVQKGHISQDVMSAIDSEGHGLSVGGRVEDCIRGMTDQNHTTRWSCSQTKEYLEDLLTQCQDQSRPNS